MYHFNCAPYNIYSIWLVEIEIYIFFNQTAAGNLVPFVRMATYSSPVMLDFVAK